MHDATDFPSSSPSGDPSSGAGGSPDETDEEDDTEADHTGSRMIDLRIHTDEPRRRKIVTRYWQLDDGGSDFREPLSKIKEEFGLSRGGVLGIVRSDSTALSGIHRCRGCGGRKAFTCRKDFRATPKQTAYVCEDCADANAPREGRAGERSAPTGPSRDAEADGEVGGAGEASAESSREPSPHTLEAAARSLEEARRHLEGLARKRG